MSSEKPRPDVMDTEPSCTRPSGWCQAADRGVSSECAVAASSVVVLAPGSKGRGALIVVGEGLSVGPFGGQGAVEPFDPAVLPGAVRLDELLPGADRGAHVAQ